MSNMKLILSVMFLLHGSQFAVTAAPSEQSPNILLIITDQQFAEAMSCAGNPHVQTPAIDGLAARGMRFTESYCTSPVCAPSRGSILTGLFPHQHGVTENGKRIRSDLKEICIEHLLAGKGYECVYAGKWHLAASRTISQTELQQHPYRVFADSNDARVSDACVQYLGEEHDRPFFLVASYTNPHDICLWAMGKQEGYQRYPVPEIPLDQCPPLPTNYAISEDEPSVLRDYYMSRHFEYETFNDERWQRYLHAYYWMVEAVDAEIGRLLDAVRANGLEENTLVVFTSDHGDGLAAHQWLGKCTHYEEATRVPLDCRVFQVSSPRAVLTEPIWSATVRTSMQRHSITPGSRSRMAVTAGAFVGCSREPAVPTLGATRSSPKSGCRAIIPAEASPGNQLGAACSARPVSSTPSTIAASIANNCMTCVTIAMR